MKNFWNCARTYRCTRNASGTNVLLDRQGHYIKAHTASEAFHIMARKFPNESAVDDIWTWTTMERKSDASPYSPNTYKTDAFTVTLWK